MLRTLLLTTLLLTLLQGATLSEPTWGYSFKNPSGWKYQKNSEVALLGHNTVVGMIFVYPHTFKSMQALKSEMRKGLDDEDVYLRLQGKLKKYGKHGYVGTYSGQYQGQKVTAKGYGTLSPYRGGAIVIAMSTPAGFSKALHSAAKKIVASLHYVKEQPNANLKQRFIGQWKSWSKYSESTVYLYPNGTYTDSSSSSYGNADASAGAVWGAASDSGGSGRWSVRGNARHGTLTFHNTDGSSGSYEYNVHVEKGQTYWNEYYFDNTLYQRSPL